MSAYTVVGNVVFMILRLIYNLDPARNRTHPSIQSTASQPAECLFMSKTRAKVNLSAMRVRHGSCKYSHVMDTLIPQGTVFVILFNLCHLNCNRSISPWSLSTRF